MTNEEYIRQHCREDVRALALGRSEPGVDMKWCLQQIGGWQRAVEKLPRWAARTGLWYPPALSMEQCSSEWTAEYKRSVVERLIPCAGERRVLADLTGGYGIDFSYLAPLFAKAVYVERNPELCRIAEHNFSVMGFGSAAVICADSIEYLNSLTGACTLVFLDPARRDGIGRKTVAIDDCTPNIIGMQTRLLDMCRYVVIKLSPMLDITAALSALRCVGEVHAVSVRGECKELLFVLDAECDTSPVYYAANLGTTDALLACTDEQRVASQTLLPENYAVVMPGMYLYEPNAGILKAGIQNILCGRYGVAKLHPMSNLFVSVQTVEGFPGRGFEVTDCCGFGKKELRRMLGDVVQANITVRNFPATVAELRKKLRLGEGGDVYLFATTLFDGSHVLVRCRKHI